MTVDSVKKELPARTGFSEVETVALTGDVGVAQAIAHAKVEIEARYIMAERHPRVWLEVEQNIVKECEHPDFALDKSALYVIPRGGEQITGLGIRFAEVAMRNMKNIIAQAPIVFEDETRLYRRVRVTDLESNTTREYDTRVSKTQERLSVAPEDAYKIISSRQNSEGKVVFTVPASEDSLYNKDNTAVSKAVRNGVLALLPKHIIKRCEATIKEVREKKVTENPDEALRKVIDAFEELGVMVPDLEQFLEHPLAQCNPKEIVNLQGIYAGLRDGEIGSWREVMDNVAEMRKRKPKPKAGDKGEKPADAKGSDKGVEGAKKKVEEEKQKTAQQAPAQPAPATAAPANPAPAPAATAAPTAVPPAQPAPVEEPPKPAEAPAPAGAAAPPEWAQEAAQPPASAPPPPPAEPEVQTPVTAPKKRLVIRKVEFPEVMQKGPEEEGVTQEQRDRASVECARLGCGLEKTVVDWTGLDIGQINQPTMESVIQVLTNYKRS